MSVLLDEKESYYPKYNSHADQGQSHQLVDRVELELHQSSDKRADSDSFQEIDEVFSTVAQFNNSAKSSAFR